LIIARLAGSKLALVFTSAKPKGISHGKTRNTLKKKNFPCFSVARFWDDDWRSVRIGLLSRLTENPFNVERTAMRDTFPLLVKTDFPVVYRARIDTLQANLGYRCKPVLHPLPRCRQSSAHRGNEGRNRRSAAPLSDRAPGGESRPDRRRS
jgi:hypothetical protein